MASGANIPVIPDCPQSAFSRFPHLRKGVVAWAMAALVGAGCSAGPDMSAVPSAQLSQAADTGIEDFPDYLVPVTPIDLFAMSEDGDRIPDATAVVGDVVYAGDAHGRIVLRIDQPTLAIVSAPHHLSEPVVVTPGMSDVPVQLLRRVGPDGDERVVMHFAGDVMLGRRYLAANPDGGSIVDASDEGQSARGVVSAIAPLFRSADISSVNFESVIGEHSAEAAYPGKRFLLQSPPAALAALNELGVDIATLGNNHSNDWQLPGVLSTIEHLDAAGIAAPGAGVDAAAARRPAVLNAGSASVGFLSYTTVTGDFVNDSLPTADDPLPTDVTAGDAWQFTRRPFEFTSGVGDAIFSAGQYLPGDAWQRFRELETVLDASVRDALWRALTAPGAFPELQDWVARRGHSGAAWYRKTEVADDVAALRYLGVDLVVVQIHGGFQFADVASSFFASAARAAVDAGADLVVGHHPHVLQGYEWYQGKLIAHSLGNFVFDQDFLSTFPSVVLRTIYEGHDLLQAKVYPVVLDGYRPKPATGSAADEIHHMLNERSAGVTAAVRLPNGSIGAVPTERDPLVEPAGLKAVVAGGMIIDRVEAQTTDIEVPIDPHGIGDVFASGLVDMTSLPDDVLVGSDLLTWGSFEDVTADRSRAGGIHWAIDEGGPVRLRTVASDGGSNTYVELTAREGFTSDVVVRPVARVTPAPHRLFDELGEPIDDVASYSFRGVLLSEGGAKPFLRLDAYRFDDTDPTRDPESILVASTRIPIEVEVVDEGRWHRFTIDLADVALRPEVDLAANAVMVYLGVAPPATGVVQVSFDDVEMIEWRRAGSYPPGTRRAIDAVRVLSPHGSVTLRVA